MSDQVGKLVAVAISTENVEEAVSALRMARKKQPHGVLDADISPNWTKFHREKQELSDRVAAFEEERNAFLRRVTAEEDGKTRRGSGWWRTAPRKLAVLTILTGVTIAGTGYATGALNRDIPMSKFASVESICGHLVKAGIVACGR
ncbi:hypothetical protein [Oceanomicrobium pacificus]|uniref:Uncharacterized protein n=1 Tax=Oceanomicrobium pacificus TaxID=2692916 RepID=A0A6B0TIC9_9RHOB|nr:hypothetical protein [Oceanomicrobium pacificus]MXU64127.1 hypothetical protein [Oceanomicrobium pacificus]